MIGLFSEACPSVARVGFGRLGAPLRRATHVASAVAVAERLNAWPPPPVGGLERELDAVDDAARQAKVLAKRRPAVSLAGARGRRGNSAFVMMYTIVSITRSGPDRPRQRGEHGINQSAVASVATLARRNRNATEPTVADNRRAVHSNGISMNHPSTQMPTRLPGLRRLRRKMTCPRGRGVT